MARLFAIKTFSLLAIVYLLNMGSLAAAGPRGGGSMGPGDIGGGSGLNDRVYDSYIKDPRKHPSFKYLKPIFDHIDSEFRKIEQSKAPQDRSSKKAFYSDILLVKTWYFVPSRLKKVAAETIGAERLTADLQQIALQSDYDILVDSDIFNRMAPRDQADLILHEAVQIIYRLKFMPMTEFCRRLMRIQGETSCTTSSKFDIDEIMAPQKFHPLDKNDYYSIRTMVSWLKHKGTTASLREFFMVARSLGFDRRIFNNTSFENRDRSKPEPETRLPLGGLAAAFRRAEVVGRLPRICKYFATDEEFPCQMRLIPFKQLWQNGLMMDALRIEVLDQNERIIQSSWMFTNSEGSLSRITDPMSSDIRYIAGMSTSALSKEIGTPIANAQIYFEKNEFIENTYEITSMVFINGVLVSIPDKPTDTCYFETINGKTAVLGVRREGEEFVSTAKLSAVFMKSQMSGCHIPN